MGRTLTAEVWRTQGWVSIKRLGPAGQPGAGFVNQCGGRDVWKAATETWLWKWLTEWGRGTQGETVWALIWEGLKGKERIRSSQERKRGWAFLRLWAGCIIESTMIFGHKTSIECATLLNTFKKQSLQYLYFFNNRQKEGNVYCLFSFHLCEVCWFGLGESFFHSI